MENVRNIRIKKGMTQSQLANLAGIKQPSLSEIEAGKKMPKLDTAKRIAAVLDCAIDDLLKDNTSL
jgi:DNA-binding XRE family transcriptional regulator